MAADWAGWSSLKLHLEIWRLTLRVISQVIDELRKTKKFKELSKEDEEEEHSLEMQFPYLKLIFSTGVKIVPIIVGNLKGNLEVDYANILRPHFKSDENFFVISSDFCHWGDGFNFTFYNKTDGKIHESIAKLDHEGMDAITKQDPKLLNENIQGVHRSNWQHNLRKKSHHNFDSSEVKSY